MATATEGKVSQKLLVTRWLVNFDKRPGLCARKIPIRRRPNKHVESRDERNVNQKPRSKRLGSDAHFLQKPCAKILQREDVTTPAANKTAEDQRRQDRQSEKDESRVKRSSLQRVHGLGRFDRGDGPTGHSPLNGMSDHGRLRQRSAAARQRLVFDLRMPPSCTGKVLRAGISFNP